MPLTTSSPQLENRVVEILDAIREVLSRLATLEEKTVWHNSTMDKLSMGQKEMADKISDLALDRGRIALLEREIQYLSGDVSKQSRQLEQFTTMLNEIQTNGKIQGKTVSLIEKLTTSIPLGLIAAGTGALILKFFGG